MKRHVLACLTCVGLLATLALVVASSAGAGGAGAQTCTGSFDSPGSVSGSYTNLVVRGFCGVTGPTTISGRLTLMPSSTLIAQFAGADLTVGGSVVVLTNATLFAGCTPDEAPCVDDPNGSNSAHIGRNLFELGALGTVLHGVDVGGDVLAFSGGGGRTCKPVGTFALFGSPAFSAYEGMHVGGNVLIEDLRSCWLGINHDQIDGSVHLLHNQLADPDAVEVLDNTIGGNLACRGNSMMWDSSEAGEEGLYPRIWEPNTVGGQRFGQCVVAPPIDSPTGVSPGPF